MYQPITGTGSGIAPVVNLPWPFLDKAHVNATVAGVPKALTWTGASQVTFSAVVPNGTAWEVSRVTAADVPVVNFTDGSVLTEGDLDLSQAQALYRLQELQQPTVSGTPLAASSGSGLIGWIASGIGAVIRTVKDKLLEPGVSVVDFGADATGVLDSTLSVQAALNSGAAKVFLPKGGFKWTSVSVPANVDFYGAGRRSTQAIPADNSSNFISVAGGGTRLRDFQVLPASQRTGGTFIRVNSQSEVSLERLAGSFGYRILEISGNAGQISVDDLRLRENNNNGASELILVDTTGNDLYFRKLFSDNNPALQPLAGLRLRGSGDVMIVHSNIINSGTDLMIDPPAGKVVASLFASDTFFDTATKGISIKPTGGGAVVRAHFHNAWASSHTSHGIEIDATGGTIDGVYFLDPQTNLNGGDGIRLISGLNVRVDGGQAGQNTGSGFYASAAASKFSVRGFTAGATDALAGNAYGIKIDAGASDFDVKDHITSGNTTANVVGVTPALASASALTVPAAGTAFAISGTTNIATIAGGFDGREVTLMFAGILTVTHATGTANSIRLAGAANFTTAAGSTLRLRHNGTQWYEIGRAA